VRTWIVVLASLYASAVQAAPHLTVGTLKLDPQFSLAASFQPQRTPPPPAISVARKPRFYIGDTWRVGNGRALSLHLTPDTDHCAPLMQLTF